MMTVGSLFSGIGGIDLGLERAGMQVKWQCERDPWARRVLAKHWPGVPCYENVTTLQPEAVEYVDVLAGGFPCQDLSVAGKRAGIKEGTRSGLWGEFARLIRGIRPRYVLVENVPGLLTNHALGRVLGDLAECGYNAEWQVLHAAQFGARHKRKRVWVVAYANSRRRQQLRGEVSNGEHEERKIYGPERICGNESWRASWLVEPAMDRVAHGVPRRVDRLRGLGNAVVPQVVEWIGRQIVRVEEANGQEKA